ncbi:biotin--[acetyl-CoA-carboxylase] ligase [Butyrivibrio sp. YAB3001]|uniref:biotin--[acetyl-CoA-carboxylase] ligase n=1 Tax=Butyrivibrio sp. YAB3001 TaxID=1520812 RepID=UPI0008F655E1|nr:biotin--[acetyl-CoA-carboxylase] ligase [Butyrivibrio sp. YAB3001]SFC65213.1 BirA family transcriptional regulator, biotin operon repressor / biotin-[acetyl-CoA-carboxylase] ligase [Butyrivibrio sp. YAB3001]
MFTKETIEESLRTNWAGRNIVFKEETGSTNDDAKKLSESGAPSGTLVVADRQIRGRGSRGRSWETPDGANIAMSLLIRPTAPPERISMLTLIMGLSVAEGIEDALVECQDVNLSKSTTVYFPGLILSESKSFPQIKWPNDIVIAGKKICGILTELHMNDDNTIKDVVIGVGINVNMLEFPEEIKDIAGSILSTTGVKLDRSKVVACCMGRFEENYEKYNRTYDLSLLREQYENRLINRRKLVKVMDPKGAYEAIAHGIDSFGALVVSDAEGNEFNINAGEVSVRGLYGYT